MMYTKEVLTKLKEGRKLTNKEIAADLGDREETTVQKWSTGVNNIQSEDIGRFYELYGIEPNEFYGLPASNSNQKIRHLDEEFKSADEVYDLVDEIIKYKSEYSDKMIRHGKTFWDEYRLKKRTLLAGVIYIVSKYLIKDYHMVIQVLDMEKGVILNKIRGLEDRSECYYRHNIYEDILDLTKEDKANISRGWLRYLCSICWVMMLDLLYYIGDMDGTDFASDALHIWDGFWESKGQSNYPGGWSLDAVQRLFDELIGDVYTYMGNDGYSADLTVNEKFVNTIYKIAQEQHDSRIGKSHQTESRLSERINNCNSLLHLEEIKREIEEADKSDNINGEIYSIIDMNKALCERATNIWNEKLETASNIANMINKSGNKELYSQIKNYLKKYDGFCFSDDPDASYLSFIDYEYRGTINFDGNNLIEIEYYSDYTEPEDNNDNEYPRIPTVEYIYDCTDESILASIEAGILEIRKTEDTSKIEERYLQSLEKAVHEQQYDLKLGFSEPETA